MSAESGKGKRLPNRSNRVKRDGQGRFQPGTKPGPGNPQGAYISQLRGALLTAVTEEDIAEIMRKLVKEAKGGDIPACTLLLNRVLGKVPDGLDILSRIEQLEKTIAKE